MHILRIEVQPPEYKEYSVEYLDEMQEEFLKITGMTQDQFVHGSGRRKTPVQRLYERMYEKETKSKKYRDDPYRAVNFRVNEEGRLVCPNLGGLYAEKRNRHGSGLEQG